MLRYEPRRCALRAAPQRLIRNTPHKGAAIAPFAGTRATSEHTRYSRAKAALHQNVETRFVTAACVCTASLLNFCVIFNGHTQQPSTPAFSGADFISADAAGQTVHFKGPGHGNSSRL